SADHRRLPLRPDSRLRIGDPDRRGRQRPRHRRGARAAAPARGASRRALPFDGARHDSVVYSSRMTESGGQPMATLEVHDPSGVIAVKQPHAPRIPTLTGRRVGFVSNEQWQAYRMLPLLKKLLEADFPDIEVLPIDAFPQGNALIGSEENPAPREAQSSRARAL